MTVLVVGNATVDLTMRTERAPVAGETVIATAPERGAGGKGLNQAIAARLCGATVRLLAYRGTDDAGVYLQEEARRFGLGDQLTPVRGASDTSIIVVSREGENLIVSTADAARAMTERAAAAAVARVRPFTVLVQGNLTKATTVAALEAARTIGARTVANPSPLTFDWSDVLPRVDVVVVNALEAAELTRGQGPADAAQALRGMGAGCAVVTLGPRGALIATAGGTQRMAVEPVAAHDTTGAGDLFCGALAALVGREPLDRAVGAAMALAAVSVTRPGAARSFPSAAEASEILVRHLGEHSAAGPA